jgi:hypothetical protein
VLEFLWSCEKSFGHCVSSKKNSLPNNTFNEAQNYQQAKEFGAEKKQDRCTRNESIHGKAQHGKDRSGWVHYACAATNQKRQVARLVIALTQKEKRKIHFESLCSAGNIEENARIARRREK